MTETILKKLSANDVGLTGAHQAGILVPKQEEILSFFPVLDSMMRNPRATLVMRERADGTRWEFNFIYYNNKRFGGTRNEYRLTCMTNYLRAISARLGDELRFTKDENASYNIELIRSGGDVSCMQGETLVLSGGWKIINTR